MLEKCQELGFYPIGDRRLEKSVSEQGGGKGVTSQIFPLFKGTGERGWAAYNVGLSQRLPRQEHCRVTSVPERQWWRQ